MQFIMEELINASGQQGRLQWIVDWIGLHTNVVIAFSTESHLANI